MPVTRHITWIRCCIYSISGLCFLYTGPAFSQLNSASNECQADEKKIQLSSVSLAEDLLQVAQAFHYLIAVHEQTHQLQSPHLNNECRTLKQWLTQLLNGSGYNFQQIKDNIIVFPETAINSTENEYIQPPITEEIIVSGKKISDVSSRRPGVLNSEADFKIDSVSLQQAGIYQLSSALELSSGVKVEENRYAIIRGMTGRYQSIRINGGELPSLDPNGQSFPLDFIPLGILNSIDLHKSVYADAPGSASAGVINLNTMQLPEENYLQLSASYVNHPGANNSAVLQGRQSHSDWYGFDDGSRDIPSALLANARNDGLSELAPQKRKVLGEAVIGDMGLYRSQSSESGEINISGGISGGKNIKAGGTVSLNIRDRWQQHFIKSTVYSTGVGFSGSSSYFHHEDSQHQRSEHIIDLNGLAALGIEIHNTHFLGFNTLFLHQATSRGELIETQGKTEENLATDAAYQRNMISWTERQLQQYQLYGEHNLPFSTRLNWQLSTSENYYDSPHELDYRYFSVEENAEFSLQTEEGTNNIEWHRMDQDIHNGGIHLDHFYAFSLFGAPFTGSLKLGAETSITERQSYDLNYWFENVGTITENRELMELRNPTDILTAENITGDESLNGFLLMDDSQGSYTGLNWKFYSARQYNGAGYILNDIDLTDHWRMISGVRRERNKILASPWQQYSSQQNSNEKAAEETSSALENNQRWLPSFSIQGWQNNSSINLNYSQTVVWPQLNELLPVVYQDLDTRAKTIGNPQLKSSDVHNWDISWQWKTERESRLYTGFYLKRIRHPAEGIFTDNNEQSGQKNYSNYTFGNSDFASVRGAEIEADYSFNLARGHNIKILGRYASIRSKVSSGDGDRALQGQPRYISALRLQYNVLEKHNINLMYKRSGSQLYITSDQQDLPAVYQQPRNQLDASISLALANIRTSLSLNNILNTEHKYTQGNYDYLIYRSGREWRLSAEIQL